MLFRILIFLLFSSLHLTSNRLLLRMQMILKQRPHCTNVLLYFIRLTQLKMMLMKRKQHGIIENIMTLKTWTSANNIICSIWCNRYKRYPKINDIIDTLDREKGSVFAMWQVTLPVFHLLNQNFCFFLTLWPKFKCFPLLTQFKWLSLENAPKHFNITAILQLI